MNYNLLQTIKKSGTSSFSFVTFSILTYLFFASGSILSQCNHFYDDFESGTYSPTWSVGTALTSYNVSTTNVPQGSYSLTGTGGTSTTHLNGFSTNFIASTPSEVSWYMYTSGTTQSINYTVMGGSTISATDCVFFNYWRGSTSEIRFVSSINLDYPATPNNWYFIELRNIDWTAKTFDIYINGMLQSTGFPFRSAAQNSISQIHLYNFNNGTGYWDQITVGATNDSQAPIADQGTLPDVTNECEVNSLSTPTATDNCDGSITGTHNASFPITSTITVTWTYEDASGNTSTQNQNVIIDDITAPVANTATLADINDECEVNSLSAPTATDNCDGTITGTHNASFPITSTTTVTWTYEDASGNTSTQNQNIIINDVTAPIANSATLADINEECEVISLSAPTANDNCDGTITGTHNASLPITANTTITWTYEDASGNTTTQNQNVIIDDVTAPAADDVSLSDINEECSVTNLIAPTATDNCDGVITGTHNASFPITTNTTVTWTYEDASGNTSTQIQEIIINDVTAPVADIASLADINEECSVTSLTAPTATDNCDGTVTGTHNLTLPITSNTTVTWIYEDANGNLATQTQDIIIEDLTAPVADITSLADINDECEVTNLTTPTATDNCDGAITGTHNASLPITSSTTVIWTYEDASGNITTQDQEVIINGINTTVTVDEPTLTADNGNTGVTYQWITCEGEIITDATNQTFSPTENGDYAVIITEGNCTDTSECATITTVGLAEYSTDNFTLYPNPTNGKFTIESDFEGSKYQIVDAQGRLIQKGIITSDKMQLELKNSQRGVYYLKVNQTIRKVLLD